MILKRKKIYRKSKKILLRRQILNYFTGGRILNLRHIALQFVLKIVSVSLLVIILSSINIYKNVHFALYKNLSDIPDYFNNYILVLDQQEILNDKNMINDLKETLVNIALNKYYKNVYIFIYDDSFNINESLIQYIMSDDIKLMLETLEIVSLKKYLSNEVCKEMYENIKDTKAIIFGNKNIALPLKIICINQGMDLEYFELKKIHKNRLASFESIFYSYIISMFYPIIKL